MKEMKSKLQEVVNKHAFIIYEFSKCKNDDILRDFDFDLMECYFNAKVLPPIDFSRTPRKTYRVSEQTTISYDDYLYIKSPLQNDVIFYSGFRQYGNEIYLYKIK